MTVRVPTHLAPLEDAAGFAERVAILAADTAGDMEDLKPHMAPDAFNATTLLLQARCRLDPVAGDLETCEAAANACRAGSTLFAIAGSRRPPSPAVPVYAGSWLSAFWFAVICRSAPRMTRLCGIPVPFVREAADVGGVTSDEFQYHWIDALQTYWMEKPGLVDKLTAALDASYPHVASIAPRDMLQQVLVPPILLFYHFIRRQHGEFAETLVWALEMHKEYWTADAQRAQDLDGTVALGPLAIACLAYDAGFPIDVESEYLPKHLLLRSWSELSDLLAE